jgi:hypothetical protein
LQVQNSAGEVTITNDGATILNLMPVQHPAAKMVCFSHGLLTICEHFSSMTSEALT